MESLELRFDVLLDPSEVEHAASVILELAREAPWVYCEVMDELLVAPLEWYASKWHYDNDNGLTRAVSAFLHAAVEVACAHPGQGLLPAMVDTLHLRWLEFLAWHGYAHRRVLDNRRKRESLWRKAGGEARKGRASPLRHAVDRLAGKLRTRKPARILAEIERDCAGDSEILKDLRASTDDPVRIKFLEVTGGRPREVRIAFCCTVTGVESKATLKTLQNYLAKKV